MPKELNIVELKAEKCKRDYWYFIQEFWECADTSIPIWNWHMEFLARHMQKIDDNHRNNTRTTSDDTIINCPPAVSKSMIISVLWNAWVWTRRPKIRFITCSYSAQISTELALKTRNLINSDKFRQYFPYLELKFDENNKTMFKTTYNGYRFSTSTNSNILGVHADYIVVDDFENQSSVNSESVNKALHEWHDSTLSTRKTNKQNSRIIYVQQRLGAKDLTNHLLSKTMITSRRYTHIVLPAVLTSDVKPPELAEKYVNNLLDVNRLDINTLEQIKIDMGSRAFNSQFMQTPSSDSDSIIKKKWLQIVYEEQKNLGAVKHYFLDTAYTKDGDYSALLEAYVANNNLYIKRVKRVKEEFPELIKTILAFIGKQDSRSKLYIEGRASGKSIIQQLKAMTTFNIVELNSKDSKLNRLNAIAATVEALRIFLIKDMWNDDLIDEVCQNEPLNDDMRDVFVFAIETLLIKNINTGKYHLT